MKKHGNLGRKRPDMSKRMLKNNPMKNEDSRLKISISNYHRNLKGKNNPNYGNIKEDVEYSALHQWIRNNFGKAVECEFCGEKSKMIHWSNKDHKYSRNREDWRQLCVKCHRAYDKGINLEVQNVMDR